MTERHGSPTFYALLEEMAETHSKKSHDYASYKNPYGNYHFAGLLATLFAHSHEDAGFIGRLGEKIYRLANLESNQKVAQNESIEDTEKDIAVIAALWMADRKDRRARLLNKPIKIRTVALPDICNRCNLGNSDEKIHHAADMHAAIFNKAQLTLKYPNRELVLLDKDFFE